MNSKKSNKLSMVAISAMAFSLFASVTLTHSALAATPKTSADYTDLATVDAALKGKIDTMIAAGIFEGVSDNSFGITENMTRAQFAKVATLLYGVTVDPTIKVSSFSDVHANDAANGWAIPYIEAAKKAGLIDGVTDTTFAPGDSVTLGQLDTVLLKGLGKKVSMTGSPWYTDAVKQATELGIHAAGKTGDQIANRADLVQSSYTPLQIISKKTLVSINSVKATSDSLKVQVTLNTPVNTSAATLTLNKGTEVIPTKTEWASDTQSATLTATTALTAGDYTVTLAGLDASLIKTATGKLTIAAPSTETSAETSAGKITINGTYTLANVMDSGLTGSATGANGQVTKETAEDPTLSKLGKEIEVKVTDSSGQTIATPGIVQSIHSSDASIVKASISADHRAYVIGNKAGTPTLV
ncbi:S-layer homology domain-containing protein [Paenibacillus sp. N3.4]|uniref:S-layer homology domain-containing protein n=1 Tax=Paenibacillus sp. N3.4 TaxID=2603222 RepID=UPI001650C2C5|nr:S-layer homology domain-containing protein [Paenibacillus sp. N3.4]